MDDNFLKLPGIEQLMKEAALTEDTQERTPRIARLNRKMKRGMQAAARHGQEFSWNPSLRRTVK